MKLAMVNYRAEDRQRVLGVLEQEGAHVVKTQDFIGGASGTCMFAVCDLTDWLKANPWLIQGIIINAVSSPLLALAKHWVTVLAHGETDSENVPAPHRVIADMELYELFSKAYVSGKMDVSVHSVEVISSVRIGKVTADNAGPEFFQVVGSSQEPWIVTVCGTPNKYVAVTLDSLGQLISLAELGNKPAWMTFKGR